MKRRSVGMLAGVVLAVMATGSVARAAEEAAEPNHEDFERQMQQAGPAMSSMMSSMMGGMVEFLARPETAEGYAAFMKNYYDALIKKGFTEEQALRIIAETGIPSLQ